MRKILLLCFSVFIMTNGYSQKMIYEFESSVGFSNSYKSLVTTGFKENIGFTLSSSIRLKNSIYFQFGLGYDLNGYTYNDSYDGYEGSFDVDTKISHNYLTIPIGVKIFSLGKKDKINIGAGIFYSYIFSEIHRQKGYAFPDGGDRVEVDTKENYTDDIQNLGRNDFGIRFDIARTFVSLNGLNIDLGLYGKLGLLSTIEPNLSKNYSFGIKMSLSIGSKK